MPVEVRVPDLDFIKLPKIRVLERPEKLRGFQPHFGVNDELCYADRSQIVLDRYRPAESVVGCLRKAESVLGALAGKEGISDTHEEFVAYWDGSPLLIDCPGTKKGSLDVTFARTPGSKEFPVISDRAEETISRLMKSGWTETWKAHPSAVMIETDTVLAVDGTSWPPSTVGEILDWTESIDKRIREKILRAMTQQWIPRTSRPFFVLRAPNGDYAFSFELGKAWAKVAGRKPSLVRDYLTGSGAKTKVQLHAVYRIDHHYVHDRNLGSRKNLLDRLILLAGCGTIGGYLATCLARLGAGEGRGKLILVDPDVLAPGNLGRHVLGMDSLFQNKAEAVADLLHRQLPHLNVLYRPADVLRVRELFQADLIVDATGEEALSTAINDRLISRRDSGKRVPDALYVWINGAGAQASSLLVDGPDTACYRCMRVEDGKGGLTDRFGTLAKGTETDIVRVGCDSYMPFPVSASVEAAALAAESALDWANGHPSPRFRARTIDRKAAKQLKDQDVKPLPTCPACQKK